MKLFKQYTIIFLLFLLPINLIHAQNSNDINIIKKNLSNQMSNKVRWVESINLLEKLKEKNIIEIGPCKILSGFVKRINKEFNIMNFNKISDIETIKNESKS